MEKKIVANLGRDNTQQLRNHRGLEGGSAFLQQEVVENKIGRQPSPAKKNRLISPEERKAEEVELAKKEAEDAYPPKTAIPNKEISKEPKKAMVSEPEKNNLSASVKHFLNKYKRKLFLTLGLAVLPAMSASAGNTHNAERIFSDTTTTSDARKIESEINKTSEKIEIKIANYFQTDKAEISPENAKEISQLVSTYINNLNETNINQFLSSTPQLNVSCDPRNTNSYENGNRGLAQARAEETQRVISTSVAGLDLSKSGLNQAQIKKVIEKFSNLNFNIPENGVIDYHTVATEADWTEAQRNEAKKMEIFQKMRFVNLELAALNTEKPKTNKEKIKNMFEVQGYNKVLLLIDKSPSMEANKKAIMDSLHASENINIPTSVIGYTNKIDTAFVAENLNGAAKIIENMKFVNEEEELTIDETIATLNNENIGTEKIVAFIVTDEELQHVSKEKLETLKKLSTDKNTTLVFTIMIGGEIHQLSLGDVENAFNKKYNEADHLKAIETTAKQVAIFNKILLEQKAQNSSPKEIKETQESLASLMKTLEKLNEVNISNFKDIAKKPIQHIGPEYSNKTNTVILGSDLATNK
jgi:hypothetical protein